MKIIVIISSLFIILTGVVLYFMLMRSAKKIDGYILRGDVTNAGVELLCNGWPLRNLDSGSHMLGEDLTEWVVSGKNEIAIIVHSAVYEKSRVALTLLKQVKGSSDEIKIASIDWKPSTGDKWPKKVIKEIGLNLHKSPWPWQKAATLSLDEKTEKEALDFIKAYHSFLSERNLHALLEANKPYLSDSASRYGSTMKETTQRFKDTWDHIFREGFTPLPLTDGKYIYRLYGNGKAMEIMIEGQESILKMGIENTDIVQPLRLFIGKVHGKFAVLKFKM